MDADVQSPMSNRDIFLRAVEITDPQQRREYLEEAYGGSVARLETVERMIAADASGTKAPFDRLVEKLAPRTVPVLEATAIERIVKAKPEFDGSDHLVIGPYKLLEPIGEGGMGVVYLAQQSQPVRRKVALKVIKPGMDSRQVIARFEAERQALAMMDHPNIARVLDAGTTDQGHPYFVMELVRGIPITEYCDRAKMPVRQRLELFCEACRAVQHAHNKGIIHRDIKPSNVLVTENDGTPMVKVIDFGVAKALTDNLTDKTMYTGLFQMIGTPLYMSPEQASLSNFDVDIRSDVYSLGVMLYELITGMLPMDRVSIKDLSYDELRRHIETSEPLRPSRRLSTLKGELETIAERRSLDVRQMRRDASSELDWIAMKAIEKDRTRRYQSARELAEDLQRFFQGHAVQACPPSTAYRLRKIAVRHKAALVATTLIAISLLVGIISTLRYADKARREANAAELARREAAYRLQEFQAARIDANSNYDVAVKTVQSMLLGLVDDQVARIPVHSRNRLLTDARELFHQLLQYNPQDANALLQRARVNAYLLEPEQALADYEQVLKFAPDKAEAHADLAKFFGSNLDARYLRPAAALKHARRAVELEPDNGMFQVTFAFLIREQDPHHALQILDNVIDLSPQLPEAFLRRGIVHWDLGNQEAALKDVERAMQLNPDFAAAVRFKAEMLAESGQLDEVLEIYTRAINLDPYSPHAYLGRASAHWRLGNPEKSLQDIDAAQNVASSYPVSHNRSVQLRTQKGKFLEALQAVNRQISNEPKNLGLRFRRAEIYLRMQRYAEALPDIDDFLANHPGKYHAYKRRALALFHLGKVDEALDDLEKALALSPNDPSTIRWIAPRHFLTSATRDQRQRLLDLADKTVEVAEPGQYLAWALTDRATILFAWDESEKAVADCTRAIEQYPRLSKAWYLHGLSELSQGNAEKYREICDARLPYLTGMDSSGAWPDYACWTYAIAPNATEDIGRVLPHAERFLAYAMEQDHWWQATEDVGQAWLRQQILGALLYRAGKSSEALQRLRLADAQYNHASSWPPYARFFLAMVYAESGEIEEARRWLRLATGWTEKALKDAGNTQWHHQTALRLLSSEAKAVVEAAALKQTNEIRTNAIVH